MPMPFMMGFKKKYNLAIENRFNQFCPQIITVRDPKTACMYTSISPICVLYTSALSQCM